MREDNTDEKLYYMGINKASVPEQVFKWALPAGSAVTVTAAEILRRVVLIRRPLALHGSF